MINTILNEISAFKYDETQHCREMTNKDLKSSTRVVKWVMSLLFFMIFGSFLSAAFIDSSRIRVVVNLFLSTPLIIIFISGVFLYNIHRKELNIRTVKDVLES